DFEESLRFQSSSNHSYPLGFMATDFAAKGSMSPVFEYSPLVGKGTPWKDAFARSFGITIDYFYDQFEAYKANGYKEGRVDITSFSGITTRTPSSCSYIGRCPSLHEQRRHAARGYEALHLLVRRLR